jgi:hypothetical protein
MQMVRRSVVSRNFICDAAYAIINMGAAQQTNKQKLDPQSTQCAPLVVSFSLTSIFIYARCRLAAIEAIIKSERGTIYGTTGVFVVCAQIHAAASERGCYGKIRHRMQSTHIESGGSTRESRVIQCAEGTFSLVQMSSLFVLRDTTHDSLPF